MWTLKKGRLLDEPLRVSLEGLEAPLVAKIECFTLMFSLPFGGGFVHGHSTYRVLSHFDLTEVSHGCFQRFRIICVMLSVEYFTQEVAYRGIGTVPVCLHE